MSRTRRKNFDKKNGKPTTGGTRDGHEKRCRSSWCWCSGSSRKRAEHKQDRRQFKQGSTEREPGRHW